MTRAASKTPAKPAATPVAAQPRDGILQTIFAAAFGLLLGLALLKFGNPVIMEKYIDWPSGGWEWALNAWPVVIGRRILVVVAVLGVLVAVWKLRAPSKLALLPLVWLLWEFVAATQSQSNRLSQPTVIHFATCVACFYLGLFSLSRVEQLWPFWAGLLVAFFLVLAAGFQQHFGGLAETRRYWFLYVYPTMTDMPPGLMKKMSSDRIFGTLFYPNTLAGVILLLLPATLALFWSCQERFTVGARRLLMGLAAAAAFACLYWSGSKGGWLLMLAIGFIGAMFLPMQRQLKTILVVTVLILGLAGFAVKYAGFFKKGATSVVARFDYWEAALKTVKANPLFGTGPGTFGATYERIKRPESEMSLMTHNDYLQQASDSGLPGFLAYALLIIGVLAYTRPKGAEGSDSPRRDWVFCRAFLWPKPSEAQQQDDEKIAAEYAARHRARFSALKLQTKENLPVDGPAYKEARGTDPQQQRDKNSPTDWIYLSVWLGLLGWALQSFVEFNLYIPAMAWTGFALMGWLLGQCEERGCPSRSSPDLPKRANEPNKATA